MTGTFCSVVGCKSNAKKAQETGKHVSFFTFPKNENILKEWIEKCSQTNTFNPKNKRICSNHFLPSDYEDELKARLLKISARRLKKNAIPSQNLPTINEQFETTQTSYSTIKSEVIIKEEPTEQELSEPTKEILHINLPAIGNLDDEKTERNVKKSMLMLKNNNDALMKENEKLYKRLKSAENSIVFLQEKVENLEQLVRSNIVQSESLKRKRDE